MVFPVVMYGCESCTIKKTERRIDAFELWCWRRLLRVPWTTRRSNQSILKEVSPECSLEGLMLKLRLQYFGHMRRADSLEKTLLLGKIIITSGLKFLTVLPLIHIINCHESVTSQILWIIWAIESSVIWRQRDTVAILSIYEMGKRPNSFEGRGV